MKRTTCQQKFGTDSCLSPFEQEGPFSQTTPNSQNGTGLTSFKLVKYFSFSSFGVILVLTLLLSWYISYNARKVMLEQNEEYSLLLAENINQQVFRRFVLPAVIRYGGIALRKAEQYELLDGVIKSVTQGLRIDSVTIYDSSKNIISYSTDTTLIGQKDLGGREYDKALAGNSNSRLEYSGSLLSLLHLSSKVGCELRTFIPFRQVKPGGEEGKIIMGVIEIAKDLTVNYENILRFQGRIIVVSSVVMGILFLILRYIVSRAGVIIERKVIEGRKLEEKLHQAERLAHLGTMVATVSHEIKSPLGIVRSTAEILQKRIQKLAPGNEHLARIVVDETIRLNDIVVEFLDFARPQKLELKPGELNTLLSKVLSFLSPQLKKQHIELVTDFDPGIPVLLLDQNVLYRALLNIMVNAIQAMADGGSLQLTTRLLPESYVELLVTDSGMGMSEEKQNQIFEPFFTDKNKGTGLGLAITKNIVEAHGATISVKSRLGQGTTFILRFTPA